MQNEKPRNIEYIYVPKAKEVEKKYDIKVLDFRDEQPNPPPLYNGVRKHKLARGKVVLRKPEDVDSITIHQTACVFGKAANQPTRHHRAIGVACHALAFRDGVVALPNHFSWFVYHGNGFNSRSLGLEAEGSYAGIPDDPKTPIREDFQSHWGDDSKITILDELALETIKVGLRVMLEEADKWGAKIKYIHAHRQSSKSRTSDPGYEIWQQVVLDFAVKELGLKTQPHLTVGTGKPIPLEWDPSGKGKY